MDEEEMTNFIAAMARSMGLDPDLIPQSFMNHQSLNRESSREERMEEFAARMKSAGEAGPPEVYSARLPPPYFTRHSYVNGRKDFLSKLKTHQKSGKGMTSIKRSVRPAVEHGVAPSMSDLKRTTLQEVARQVNHIHLEKVLFVYTIENPNRIISTNTLVQDVNGDCLLLCLYNYVRTEEDPIDVLPNGAFLALIAPYMKNSEGSRSRTLMLRCDNPQCVLEFDSKVDWEADMNGNKARKEQTKSPSALRKEGNEAFGRGELRKAAQCYSKALKNPSINYDDKLACLSNRSEVYLRQSKWEDAEKDARLVLSHDHKHTKARFRLSKALTKLGKLGEATELTEVLLASNPKERLFQELSSEVQRLTQEQTGRYDLITMRKEVNSNRPFQFHANFASPKVLFGTQLTHYRGCKALEDISENEILVASKAFAFVPYEMENDGFSMQVNPYDNTVEDTSKIQLTTEIVSLLRDRPCLGRELYALSAGEGFPQHVPESNLEKIDIPRIRCILTSNSFSQSSESDEVLKDWELYKARQQKGRLLDESELKAVDNKYGGKFRTGTGLWLKESMFNHSCTPNCTWSQIGDHMFVRSARPIKADEELCIAYTPTEEQYEVRKEKFENWVRPGEGFCCLCDLCTIMRSNSKLFKLEAKVAEAYKMAGRKVSFNGTPMAVAANMTLPRKQRLEVIKSYQDVPLRLQHPTVSMVEVMEGTCKSFEHDYEGALASYERAAEIGYAARGGARIVRAKDLWRVVGAAMACNRPKRAMEALGKIWLGPFFKGMSEADAGQAFIDLSLENSLPFWVDSPDASRSNQMRAMVKEIVCSAKKSAPGK